MIRELHRPHSLLASSSWAFTLKISGMIAGYAFAVAVASFGDATAWGTFSLCLMLMTAASVLGRAGIDTALLRLVAQHRAADSYDIAEAAVRRGLIIVIPSGFALTIALWATSDVIAARVFGDPSLQRAIKVASIGVLPTCILLVLTETLRALKRVRTYLLLSLVGRHVIAAAIFIGLTLVTDIPAALAAVGAYCIALLLLSGIAALIVWRAMPGVGTRAHRFPTGTLLALSFPLLFASSLQFIKGWIDTLMLGYYMTPADVGIYNIALKFALLVGVPLMAVNSVAAPRFAEAFGRGDMRQLKATVDETTRLVAVTSLPIALAFVIAPHMLLSVVGVEFADGANALRILALGHLVNSLAGSVGYLLQMTGGQKAFQNVTVASAALGVALNLLLVPSLGLTGAALSTTATLIFWNGACMIYIRMRYHINTFYWPQWRKRGAPSNA